jgi:RNA polymerase sigma-70 factor (ECF subfamily)
MRLEELKMGEASRTTGPGEVTQLLRQLDEGCGGATERLLPLLYQELHTRAQSLFKNQRAGHTLQPTALVHEAFIRLVGNTKLRWESRAHVLAVAATAMREVLADHARRKRAAKRGGQWRRVTLSGIGSGTREYDPADIDEALKELAELDERQARIVELRFFGGLTEEEIAKVLRVSERTVRNNWNVARAWLRLHLSSGQPT